MKARAAASGGQLDVARSASARETAREELRQNVAGAPYYRGLHWDC